MMKAVEGKSLIQRLEEASEGFRTDSTIRYGIWFRPKNVDSRGLYKQLKKLVPTKESHNV